MYKIELKIKELAQVNVYTNFKTLEERFRNNPASINRTIPITKIEIIEENLIENQKDTVYVIEDNNKHLEYNKENNNAFLYINEEKLNFPDLMYVILTMFSNKLQQKDKYLIHSSALKNQDNKSVILVGNANAGKTSLAYELISKHNFKLISNDHTVIGIENDQPKIYTGTKEIQMRAGAIQLYFPELFRKLVDLKKISQDKDIWSQKIIVNDIIEKDKILLPNEDESILTDIYSIDTYKEGSTFISKKDYIDRILFIYDNLSRLIKGTYNFIPGFNYPMPSLENSDSLERLTKTCQKITEQCDVYEGKGTVEEFAKTLVKNYER